MDITSLRISRMKISVVFDKVSHPAGGQHLYTTNTMERKKMEE